MLINVENTGIFVMITCFNHFFLFVFSLFQINYTFIKIDFVMNSNLANYILLFLIR